MTIALQLRPRAQIPVQSGNTSYPVVACKVQSNKLDTGRVDDEHYPPLSEPSRFVATTPAVVPAARPVRALSCILRCNPIRTLVATAKAYPVPVRVLAAI